VNMRIDTAATMFTKTDFNGHGLGSVEIGHFGGMPVANRKGKAAQRE
jgi:hypothetical protein